MLRLVTFSALLALAVAQNGYDYNRPGKPFSAGKPFSQGTTPTRPGASSPAGYPAPTSPSSFPSSPAEEYPTGGEANPGFQPSFPSTPNQGQGYPSGRPQQTLPAQTPGYQGQAQTGPSAGYPQTGAPFPTQGQNNYPTQTAGQTGGQNYQGQNGGQNYQGQTGASGYQGQTGGQNFQGQTGAPGYQGQTGGQNYQGQNGVQNFQGQAGGNGFATGSDDTGAYEGGDYSAIPGEPDRDYPILTEIPETSFRCDAQAYPGYYADVETRCQVFHVCANNRTYDFLCPNGTIFSQEVFVCVWWNQFDCNSAPSFFELNANLYDYSITGSQGNAGAEGNFPQGQGQTGAYPGAGATGPSAAYPTAPGSYPGAQPGGQAAYPGGAQTPTGVYPAPSQSQSYPTPTTQGQYNGAAQGSYTGSQSPSTSNTGYQDSGAQGPTSSYPGSSPSSGFPGSRPSGNQGYPSGRPNGPSFPSGRPGQGDGFPPKPNREYLPPRN